MVYKCLYNAVSDFFLPIDTGTGTHSIGKNGIKIKRIGIFYHCTCNVKLLSKEEKVRTRQEEKFAVMRYNVSGIVIG